MVLNWCTSDPNFYGGPVDSGHDGFGRNVSRKLTKMSKSDNNLKKMKKKVIKHPENFKRVKTL